MNQKTISIIKNNSMIYRYLRENSYEYLYLFRDDNYLETIEKESKKLYQEPLERKIEKLQKNINLINSFINIMDKS